ncbi:MAG: glycosyl transferase group 1 [Mucilaginibacter sp.]|nr:glycosyl transferase group 1 [Mucilaginibacter sp.]
MFYHEYTMKIAVWHNLNSGGGKRALYDHIKGLISLGHTVVSFCPDTADQSYLPISTLTVENILPLKKAINNKKRFKLFNSYKSAYEIFEAELAHCKACADIINKGDFDLLFANSSTISYISHIGRYVKIPKVIYLGEPNRGLYEAGKYFIWRAPSKNGSNFIFHTFKKVYHLFKMYSYSLIVREEHNSAITYDRVLVNSSFSRESVKRAYGIDSKVCYLGIDTEKFQSVNIEKKPYVIGLGSISKPKGIDQIIDALSRIDENIRPELVWIGNTKVENYYQYLLDYSKKLNVKVCFKTNISDTELLKDLSAASALLYFPHLEPFGLAPLEANSCGTTVVAIKEGGLRETIIEGVNGFLVDDFNPDKIANSLKPIIANLEYAKLLGDKGRDHIVKNWSLSSGIKNLEKHMVEVVNNSV